MAVHDKNLQACVLAALILHDAGVPITGDKIKALLDASQNADVPLVYCNMIAKFAACNDVTELLLAQVQASPQQQPNNPQTGTGENDAGYDSDIVVCGSPDEDDDDEMFAELLFS